MKFSISNKAPGNVIAAFPQCCWLGYTLRTEWYYIFCVIVSKMLDFIKLTNRALRLKLRRLTVSHMLLGYRTTENLINCWWECKSLITYFENCLVFYIKVKYMPIYDSNSTPSCIPMKNEYLGPPKDIHVMFIAILFISHKL